MIYQELSLARHLTVMENIVLGWSRPPAVCEMGRVAAPSVGGHGAARPQRHPARNARHRLSIAEQQLVEIARAIAVGAGSLVLDEPTSSLACNDIAQLFDLVRRLKRRGSASSTFPIFSRKSARSATASPFCGMAAASAPATPRQAQ